MRVRVRVDIKKPFKRCLRVDISGDGTETIMVLRYERLPNHCFRCRMIDHITSECPKAVPLPMINGKEDFPFRLWLRASGGSCVCGKSVDDWPIDPQIQGNVAVGSNETVSAAHQQEETANAAINYKVLEEDMCDLRTIGNSEIVSGPHSLTHELQAHGPEEYGPTYKSTAYIQQTAGLGLPIDSHCGLIMGNKSGVRRIRSSRIGNLGTSEAKADKVWSLRNTAVHEPTGAREVDVVAWARGFLAEFHDGQLLKDSMPPTSSFRDQKWTPPNPGMYKINCDAAIGSADRLVGFGIVIRDSEGFVMASSSQRIEASFTPQVAEALAISRGLQLAIDTGLHPCRIASDAKIVVDWINSGEVLCSEIGNVIADISTLLENEHCVSINFVSRKVNQVAHVLAKNGLVCAEDLFWLEEFPSCVGSLVAAECRVRL
ncbi:hypothetical protein Dsin_002296 [Dipteronia sinensis]|uniref:RNase H type-1 domain-containing protein n=1 Tax=Dipteronia sinensis TaxID=43782 RepID=A0AAE0B6U0_9ROSI|nr:hypothetical protein Dsin_002296 [Dipteronia sinensis]